MPPDRHRAAIANDLIFRALHDRRRVLVGTQPMVAAPLPGDELLRRADLAGYARVTSRNLPFATIRFTTIWKGKPQASGLLGRLGLARSVTVLLHAPPSPMRLGEWSDADAYEPGRRIRVYLSLDSRTGFYETVWWNGVDRA